MHKHFTVHVIGPNLIGDKEGYTFHVHNKGCADVTRNRMYAGREFASDRKATYDIESLDHIVQDVYADILGEDDTVENLRGDFKVFPCVGDLPDQVDTPVNA